MDELRSCYQAWVRISKDPAVPLVKIRWYFAPEGAQPFPGRHAFGSNVWETNAREYPTDGVTLGEIDLGRKWDKGLPPVGVTGEKPGSPVEWFLTGVPGPSSYSEINTRCGVPYMPLTVREYPDGVSVTDVLILEFEETDFTVTEVSPNRALVALNIPEPPPALRIEEVDGSPSYAGAETLRVNQADGLQISQPGEGIVRLNLAAASPTQAGGVTTGSQTFAGRKYFGQDVVVLGGKIWLLSDVTGNSWIQTSLTSLGYHSIGILAGSGGQNNHSTSVVIDAQSNQVAFECSGTGDQTYPVGLQVRDSISSLATGQTGSFLGAQFTSGLWTGGSSTALTSLGVSGVLSSTGGTTPTISVSNFGSNLILAGPVSGSPAAPTARLLEPEDMPTQDSVADLDPPPVTEFGYIGGGTNNDQCTGVGDVFSESILDDNFASLSNHLNFLEGHVADMTARINALLAELRSFGAIT